MDQCHLRSRVGWQLAVSVILKCVVYTDVLTSPNVYWQMSIVTLQYHRTSINKCLEGRLGCNSLESKLKRPKDCRKVRGEGWGGVGEGFDGSSVSPISYANPRPIMLNIHNLLIYFLLKLSLFVSLAQLASHLTAPEGNIYLTAAGRHLQEAERADG